MNIKIVVIAHIYTPLHVNDVFHQKKEKIKGK